jgi:hypothetical protein
MNMNILFAAAAFIICSGSASAQNDFPRLEEKAVAGLHVVSEKYYDGTSLWGYIDGGADVYLEYGFSKLLARTAEVNGMRFQVDLYKMIDPASAFGIYSISTFTCARADSSSAFTCSSRFQFQAARGTYYLSIINDKGTDSAGLIGITIARHLLSGISDAECGLPQLFRLPAFTGCTTSIKFIKGRLGIENGYPGWEALFEGCGGFSFYVMSARRDSADAALAVVAFGSPGGRDKFSEHAGFHPRPHGRVQQREADGLIRCLWTREDSTCVYLEIPQSRTDAASIITAIDTALAR